jgi:phosphate transport system protein
MSLRTQFDEKLAEYYRNILYMGSMVEQFLLDVTDAFAAGNVEKARELIDTDLKIDSLQIGLEQESVMLLLLQSPVAKDLRKIVTSIKIVSDLERIGDYSVHLAKLGVKGNRALYAHFIPRICDMARIGATMIRDSLTAYIEDNEKLALDTARRDDELDRLKKDITASLIRLQPRSEGEMKQIWRYLSVCKDLERLGDHCTTICEWVVFSVRGEIVNLNGKGEADGHPGAEGAESAADAGAGAGAGADAGAPKK